MIIRNWKSYSKKLGPSKTPVSDLFISDKKKCPCGKLVSGRPWDNDFRKDHCSKCTTKHNQEEAEAIHLKKQAENFNL